MVLAWETLYTNDDITTQRFVDNIRVNIDEDTEDLISNTQILEFLKRALVDISSKTGLNMGLATTVCDGSTRYALPDDTVLVHSIYYVDAGGRTILLRKASPSIAYNFGQTQLSPNAQFWNRQGNYIYLYGAPSSGQLQVWLTKAPTVPATIDSATYIDLPKEYTELCYQYVEWMYWRRVRDTDQTIIARDEYNKGIQDAIFKVQKDYGKGVVFYGQRT
jgi:hypothetical protein